MNIKMKYGIGKNVYIPNLINGYYVPLKVAIASISVIILKGAPPIIGYSFKYQREPLNESDCYETRPECQSACDKLNGMVK